MKVSVRAHPNSRKNQLLELEPGRLEIWLRAPALENQANAALVEILAEHFHVRKSAIELLRGARSKEKLFEIAES